MAPSLLGLHHVTAIVDDPQENVDFYTNMLGLRLVKQTVNFDDPYTYHLYYGDEAGRPGTIITFFPWPSGRRGSRGTGQISAMAFAVPDGSLPFWQERLAQQGIRFGGPEQRHGGPEQRHGAPALSLYDPAGLLLELVEQPVEDRRAGERAHATPPGTAIQRLLGVTLTIARGAETTAFLQEQLGFRPVDDGATRFALADGNDLVYVDLIDRPDVPRGEIAAGSVHHVAWRVADDEALLAWQGALAKGGANVTDVRDRQYFHSIYFREPSGVLFELATDPPGFAADEAPDALGSALKLPPWLEEQRANIERHLPPLAVR
jgi:glyoxalase family protein